MIVPRIELINPASAFFVHIQNGIDGNFLRFSTTATTISDNNSISAMSVGGVNTAVGLTLTGGVDSLYQYISMSASNTALTENYVRAVYTDDVLNVHATEDIKIDGIRNEIQPEAPLPYDLANNINAPSVPKAIIWFKTDSTVEATDDGSWNRPYYMDHIQVVANQAVYDQYDFWFAFKDFFGGNEFIQLNSSLTLNAMLVNTVQPELGGWGKNNASNLVIQPSDSMNANAKLVNYNGKFIYGITFDEGEFDQPGSARAAELISLGNAHHDVIIDHCKFVERPKSMQSGTALIGQRSAITVEELNHKTIRNCVFESWVTPIFINTEGNHDVTTIENNYFLHNKAHYNEVSSAPIIAFEPRHDRGLEVPNVSHVILRNNVFDLRNAYSVSSSENSDPVIFDNPVKIPLYVVDPVDGPPSAVNYNWPMVTLDNNTFIASTDDYTVISGTPELESLSGYTFTDWITYADGSYGVPVYENTTKISQLQNNWYERWLIEEYELPWSTVHTRYLDLLSGDDTNDGSFNLPYRNVSAFVSEANAATTGSRKNDIGWLLFCRKGATNATPRIVDYNVTPGLRVNIAIIGVGKAPHVYGSSTQATVQWAPETNVPATHYIKGADFSGDLIIRGIAFDSTSITGVEFKGMIRSTDGGGTLRVENCDFLAIDDSQSSAGASIAIDEGYDVFIQNNTFYEGNIYVDSFDGFCRIRNNDFHYTYTGAYYSETSAQGVKAYIYLRGGYGANIENNVFTDVDENIPIVIGAGFGGSTIIGPNRLDGWYDSSTADTTPYYFMGTSGGTPDAGKGFRVYHVQESSGNVGYEVERNFQHWARTQVWGGNVRNSFDAFITSSFSGSIQLWGEPTMAWGETLDIGTITSAGFTSGSDLSAVHGDSMPMYTLIMNDNYPEDLTLYLWPAGSGSTADGNNPAVISIPCGVDRGQILANGTIGYFDINNWRSTYPASSNQYVHGGGYGAGGAAGGALDQSGVSAAVNWSLSAYESSSAGVAAYSDLSGINITIETSALDYIVTGVITGSTPVIISGVISGISEHGDIYWSKVVGIPLEQFNIFVE